MHQPLPLNRKIALTIAAFLCSFISVRAQDSLANLPELKLPLTNKKMVIAHCMTHIIRYEGREFEDGCNPRYYPVTSPIGGLTQVHPMFDSVLSHATLDQAVELEMRAAKRCGIDGFQFYYPLGVPVMDTIIEAYFRVAQQKNIDFKFTFCFSHPNVEGLDENAKLLQFAVRVNNIMNDVGRDNPHWLRTPDGRLIVYLWYGEQVADLPVDMQGRPAAYYAARAYRKLANALHERFACVYSINESIDKSTLDDILDYFPAVWIWTEGYEHKGMDEMVANYCKKRTRVYTETAFPDFYTSKVLKPGTWDMLVTDREAEAAGLGGIQRKYMTNGLSLAFRNELEFAMNHQSPIINLVTWNDYPEGHHLAPEINHNFGFSILLNYYKALWQGLPNPYADHDVAIAFFKKYKSDATPKPYKVSVDVLGTTIPELSKKAINNIEDSIEVVTILPKPGQLIVNGETVNVPAGLHSQRFRSQPGPVKVAVQRDGVITKSFTTPEWITTEPLRTDRLTYTFDTEFQQFYHDIFGDIPPQYSLQYNKDAANYK